MANKSKQQQEDEWAQVIKEDELNEGQIQLC